MDAKEWYDKNYGQFIPTGGISLEDVKIIWKAAQDEKNDLILRKLVWLNHGCPISNLYGDDGELQCSVCMIDFKRDSAESIQNKITAKGRKIVEAQITAAGGWDKWRKGWDVSYPSVKDAMNKTNIGG